MVQSEDHELLKPNPDPAMPKIVRGISIDKTMNAYVYGNNLRKMGQGIKFYDHFENTELHLQCDAR